MHIPLLVLLVGCGSGLEVEDPAPCSDGFVRGDDGACYEVGDDTAGGDDTAADTDPDTDTDTGGVEGDEDGDGYTVEAGDCDDADPRAHPGAEEEGWDAVDQDCDGEDLHDWLDLAIGCGIASTGEALCWGDYAAEYGLDAPPAGPFVRIVAGGDYACALDAVGLLSCWGDGAPDVPAGTVFADIDGLCGVTPGGGIECLSTWGTVALAGYRRVADGGNYLCALGATGSAECWDYGIGSANDFGQANPPDVPMTALDVADLYGCGIREGGALLCWGGNEYGQLNPPDGVFTQVSTQQSGACALDDAGEIRCWGHDQHGELAPPAGPFVDLVTGGPLTCGIRADGRGECWGYDQNGVAGLP